jgi:hypothetical protein
MMCVLGVGVLVYEPNRQRPEFRNPAAQQLSLEIADTPLSAMAEPIVASLFMQWEHEERLVVSRKTSQGMLEIGSSYQIDLENRGVLHSILFDSQRRVTVDSIYRRLILDTIASFPVDAAPKKARLAPAMLKPKPRPEHAGAVVHAEERARERAATSPTSMSSTMASATAPLNEIRRGRGRKKQSEMATPAG